MLVYIMRYEYCNNYYLTLTLTTNFKPIYRVSREVFFSKKDLKDKYDKVKDNVNYKNFKFYKGRVNEIKL